MAASYSWNPGIEGVMSPWAIFVPLLPDEIISSWLVRAALTQGCDPLVLTGEVWPKWRIWTQDADRFLVDERIKSLCAVSGIPMEAFRAATLYPIASQIFGRNPPEKASWPWVLTLGARNTKRHGGMQYCSSCLTADAKPYYRRQWRFAWHTCCEKHGVSLRDRCHACGVPIEPHRLLAEDQNIAVCATCKADLRNASSHPCPADALAFQGTVDHVVLHGQGSFQGQIIDISEWFVLMNFFESLIRRANRSGAETLNDFLHRLGLQLPDGLPVLSGAGVDMLRTNERQKLLGMVYPLVVADKEQFEIALKESGITLQTFCSKGETLPKPLLEITSTLPDKPRVHTRKAARKLVGPRPRQEVMRMMARLQRKLEMAQR